MDAAAYTRALKGLLPSGKAWPAEVGSTMHKVLQAIADELARIDGRAAELIEEFDPRTTNELLTDFERVYGLPDPCLEGATQTVVERRNALVAKVVNLGGQSRAYFIALADALGYTITITEFSPFVAGGSEAGDPLTNGDWAFAWQVNAPETTVTEFRVGLSGCGDPLRSWGNELLECVIDRQKPAHTFVLFAYGE